MASQSVTFSPQSAALTLRQAGRPVIWGWGLGIGGRGLPEYSLQLKTILQRSGAFVHVSSQ